jgi:hypothetical protein
MRPSFPAVGPWTFKLLGEEPSGWSDPKELSVEISPTLHSLDRSGVKEEGGPHVCVLGGVAPRLRALS